MSKQVLIWIACTSLASQLLLGFIFYGILRIQNTIVYHNDILASEAAEDTDVEFINQLKKEADFNQEVQILVGPYKKLFGNNFKYRLYKLKQHFVFVEQSQTAKETFLILFDKIFYNELSRQKRKGVLAHEMWHIFSSAKGTTKLRNDEEKDADNYAARHVSTDTMLDLCRQYEGDETMREIRIQNLERQRPALKQSAGI